MTNNHLFSSSGLFSWIQIYLAGGEIIMLSHSKRGIHEYLRHGGQVFNTQHLQPEEVSVYGLSVDCLTKKSCMCRSEMKPMVSEKSLKKILLIKTSPHIVRVLLMCLNGLLEQRQPLCVLLGIFTAQ